MKIADIEPFVRYASITNFRPFSEFGYAADCRLFYILEGSCRLDIGESTHFLSRDTLVLICPGERYKFSDTENVGVGVINFDFDRKHERVRQPYLIKTEPCGSPVDLIDFDGFSRPIVLSSASFARERINEISDEYYRRRLYYRERASGIMKILIFDIVRRISAGQKFSDDKIDAVLSYIDTNISLPLDGESLGAKFGYHPYYLSRMVKMYTGKTLKQYIITRRIEEGKRLIKTTDLPISEIAPLVGFENGAYFSNCFRDRVKMSPGEYRRGNNDYI